MLLIISGLNSVFTVNVNDVKSIDNPMDKVEAGLLSKSDEKIPLKSVHIRAKLLDLAAQVGTKTADW